MSREVFGIPDSLHGAELRRTLDKMYREIFTGAEENIEASVARYFSENYVQVTDGVSIRYPEFLEHVRHLMRVVKRIDIQVLDALRDGDQIADRHIVKIVRNDGANSTIEVYLFGELDRDGRCVSVTETTRVVEGAESSKTLGSEIQ